MNSEWQPIETAPKDGTTLRLKSHIHAPSEVFHWHQKHKRWECFLLTIMGARIGWWGKEDEQPTHWMPLPDPPKDPANV